MSFKSKFKEIFSRKEDNIDAMTVKSFERSVNYGKLLARERIKTLLDSASFHELDMFVHCESGGMEIPADGVICGTGTINNRPVCIYAQDFTATGSSLGSVHADKIIKIIKLAIKLQTPLIGICDTGFRNLPEYVDSLAACGEIASQYMTASGKIPLIAVVLGTCKNEAAAIPALSDFVFTTEYIEEDEFSDDNTKKEHHSEFAPNDVVAHFYAENEKVCFKQIRQLLNYIGTSENAVMPAIENALPPQTPTSLGEIIPSDYIAPFDVVNLITAVTDNSYFFECGEYFAKNIVTGFASISGKKVGIIANQSMSLDGVIDSDAIEKATHFIRCCNMFKLPIVTFVDTPGLPTENDPHSRIIYRQSSALFRAYSQADVLKVTVIIRRAYGYGFTLMGSKYVGGDFVYAFPSTDIAAMSPDKASAILFAKEISAARNSEEIKKSKLDEYCSKFANPFMAAAGGYIDAVIKPDSCRNAIIHAIKLNYQ